MLRVLLLALGVLALLAACAPATEGERLRGLLESLGDLTANVRIVPDLGGVLLVNPGAAVLSGERTMCQSSAGVPSLSPRRR